MKLKGIRFAKKTITSICRPIFRSLGFTALRRPSEPIIDSFSGPASVTGLNLGIMSFNIRRGTKKDGKNHWIFRRSRVQEILNRYRPDVLGLQEALDFQISEIRTMLPGYEMVGVGNLGGSKGLHNAIFYDAERFILLEEGTFWFSETPNTPGSRGWGNIIPRTCTWARFIEKDSRQAFYFYNIHLDHISLRSRKKSVVLLTRFIHERPSPDPFVLTGDFNARERSSPIQYLKGKSLLKMKNQGSILNPEPLMDTFRVRYPYRRNVATFHGFRNIFFRLRLDYIFVPSSVGVQDTTIIQLRLKKRYPSDHYPLFSHINLNPV
jgi:endonuclease/exonuclease/phosphatase family metal-dependent hydrolase